MNIPDTKEGLLDLMRKLSATIGMYQIKRKTGEYVSITELDSKKREFDRLSKVYKRRYYGRE